MCIYAFFKDSLATVPEKIVIKTFIEQFQILYLLDCKLKTITFLVQLTINTFHEEFRKFLVTTISNLFI